MRSRRFAAIKQRMQAGLRFRVVLSLCQTRNSPRGFVLRPKTQLDLFHTKKKSPGRSQGSWEMGGIDLSYWFGSNSCVKPVVFTSRKSGVRGGKRVGVKNSMSKL